ncbi:hypothetical protein DERP_000721, partial [Dermatophagoides pteronyssinus]
FCC